MLKRQTVKIGDRVLKEGDQVVDKRGLTYVFRYGRNDKVVVTYGPAWHAATRKFHPSVFGATIVEDESS